MADTEGPLGISHVFAPNLTHCKAVLNSGK